MGFFSRLFGRSEPAADEPFVEYPSGEFDSAVEAMTSAFQRLLNNPAYSERWITFSGQGKGAHEDAYQIEDVRVRGRTFDLSGEDVDLEKLAKLAGLEGRVQAQRDHDGMVTLANADAALMARSCSPATSAGLSPPTSAPARTSPCP